MITELINARAAAPLFAWCEDSLIYTCLEGAMGHVYADVQENPASAAAVLGDFCILGGKAEPELASYAPIAGKRDFMILIPENEGWAEAIETAYGEKARRVTRYATRKEGDIFDREHLKRVVAGLPAEYTLRMMDESLFLRCREMGWCRDWVAQYDNYAIYQKYGLGAVILRGQEPVSGASSYCGYSGGIEIEIGTREDYRRRGLAYVCGAKLILECLKKGWYPSWDAQNPWSLALSGKLGYHFAGEYPAYEIRM